LIVIKGAPSFLAREKRELKPAAMAMKRTVAVENLLSDPFFSAVSVKQLFFCKAYKPTGSLV